MPKRLSSRFTSLLLLAGLLLLTVVLAATARAAQPAPGSAKRASSVESISSLLISFSTVLIVIALLLWVWKSRWYRAFMRDRLAANACIAFLSSIALITILTYHFERNNKGFENLAESFWSITIYTFSGLEDRNPQTAEGRFLATLGLLVGPVFFAVMTSWLAKTLINPEKLMPQHLKDHYLILNWSPRTIELVRELHHPVIKEREGNAVIVVLTDDESLSIKRLKEAGSGEKEIFEDFYLSIGDPTAERALRNANAHDAKTILILADERAGAHADEGTIRSVIMLRRIAQAEKLHDMHVVAELVNPANEQVLDEIAKDFPGLLERISGLQVRTCLMAQAILNEGVVDFYSDLLRVTEDTSEVYARPIPDSAAGITFREYGARLFQEDGCEEPLIAVGVQRRINGRVKIFCNPRSGSPGSRLEKGDQLILLAYEPPGRDALPENE